MNYVLIGGGGFIGSHLSLSLINPANRVIVFDSPTAPFLELLSKHGAEIITGSFLNEPDLKQALSGAEVVYHLASTTVPKSSIDDPVFDVKTNLIGSINLLSAARDANIKKIVFASSGGTVYGIPRCIPITEEHPTNPISSYGIIKLAVEKYLALFRALYGLDYSILRISNAYGERQSSLGAQGVIPVMLNRVLHNQEIRIWGDGSVIRDYIYISDIVSALIGVSNYSGEYKIFNISSGIGHSINDIVNIIRGLFTRKLDIVYEPSRAYDVPVNILDNSLAKSELLWHPNISLREGLVITCEFYNGHIN